MMSFERKPSLIALLMALSLIVTVQACTGFFVNQPTSISVTQAGASSFTVAVGAPKQLTATATYSSGTKIVTNSATWSSSTSCATVSTTGLLTAVGPSSGITVTATLAGIQGTINGTTTGGSAQTLTITPTNSTVSLSTGSVQFTATDSSNNNVTSSATWTSSNTSELAFSSTTPGLATLLLTGTPTVNASTSSGSSCASGSTTVTIQ